MTATLDAQDKQLERQRRRYRRRAQRALAVIAAGAAPLHEAPDWLKHAWALRDEPGFVEALRRQASDSILVEIGLSAWASRTGVLHVVGADGEMLCGARSQWRGVPHHRWDSSPSRCKRCQAGVDKRCARG